MNAAETVNVRFFGVLHEHRRALGLPSECDFPVPVEGATARSLALQMELPLDVIEGVFQNRVVRDLSVTVVPGDRIAFVPKGTPGPHRYFLGLYEAGQEDDSSDE